MKTGYGLIGAFGLGAGVVYLLDPDCGQRPRAWLRRRVGAGQAGPSVPPPAPTGWDTSDAAVRERLAHLVGRYASRPQAIDVRVANGVVTLHGAIADREVDHLVAAVARQPGVRRVDDRLVLESSSGKRPTLTPTTGLLVGAGGGLLLRWAIGRHVR